MDSKVTTRQVLMSPEMAKSILLQNTHNRPVSQEHVDNLARQMTEGAWMLTHQGVAVSSDKVLLDGQHRLLAVIASGVTVPMLLTTGVAPAALLNIDRGKPRTVAQNAHLLGLTTPKVKVAWANAIKYGITRSQRYPVSPTETLLFCQENHEAIAFALSLDNIAVRTGPVGGALILSWPLGEEVRAFFRAFVAGTELTAGTAVHTYRKYYYEGTVRAKDDRRVLFLKTLRAIDAHIKREGLKQLQGPESSLDALKVHFPKGTIIGDMFEGLKKSDANG